MKKIIVLLTIVGLFISTPALAGSINVYGDKDGTQVIYQTDDNGFIRTYTSHKVGDNTRIIYDNQGNSTMVHDYSTDPEPEKGSDFFDIPDLLD